MAVNFASGWIIKLTCITICARKSFRSRIKINNSFFQAREMFRKLASCFFFSVFAISGCNMADGGPPMGAMPVVVAVEQAQRQLFSQEVSLVGTLHPDEINLIKSEIDGVVEEIAFEEGRAVVAGDVLLRIDESKLKASQQEAEANFRLREADLKRSDSLLKSRAISSQEHDQVRSAFEVAKATLKRAERELLEARIVAPFDGIMDARLVSPGQFVSRGDRLSTLVSVDPLKLEFAIPERYAAMVREGLRVDFSVTAYPSRRFQGEIYFVSPLVDEATRTLNVRANVANKDNTLKAGMFANLDLSFSQDEVITVSEAALINRGNIVQVFTVEEDKAFLKEVQIGSRRNGRVVIVDGLKEGETVVTQGVQKLRPGSRVIL